MVNCFFFVILGSHLYILKIIFMHINVIRNILICKGLNEIVCLFCYFQCVAFEYWCHIKMINKNSLLVVYIVTTTTAAVTNKATTIVIAIV